MEDARSLVKKGFILLSFMGLVAFAGCSGGKTALKDSTDMARLEKVDVVDSGTSTTVVLSLDKPASFTSVRLPDPPKVIIDLAGVDLGENRESIKVDKGPIMYITPSRVPDAKRIARLEIGLSSAADFVSTQDGSTIRVMFEKPKEASGAEAPTTAETPVKQEAEEKPTAAPPAPAENIQVADTAKETASQAPEAQKQAPSAPQQAPSAPQQASAAPVAAAAAPVQKAVKEDAPIPEARTLKDILFVKSGEGYAIKIEGDGKFSKPEVFRLGTDRLVVDLPGMASMKSRETIKVGGKLLKSVRMAAHKENPRKVRVVLDLAQAFGYDVKGDGKALVVSVFPPGVKTAEKTAAPVKAAAMPAPGAASKAVLASKAEAPATAPVKPVMSRPAPDSKPAVPVNLYISTLGGRTVLSSAPIEPAPGTANAGEKATGYVETPTKIYTGGRISFDIQDADLANVMKLLADVAGLNLIMDPAEVKGKVTLKLDNVPWDQALDVLLKIYNLDKVIEGNVLRIASKARLDDEKRRDLLAIAEQKKLEEQAEDLYTKTFKINYTDATDLEPKVKKVLSARGDATANPSTNELIITDIKSHIQKAEQLIKILDKEVHQIVIEARIINVDVGYSRSLGVSWGLTRNSAENTGANFTINGGSTTAGATATPGSSGNPDTFKLNAPAALAAAGGILGTFSWGILKDINLDLTIEALETINKLEQLSAPKLLTLENKAATITQGVTIYVQTTSAAGTAPMPLNANLSLTVTPRVTGDNYIMMQVTATDNTTHKGAIDNASGATAAIDTNSVTTNVLVKDGDTVVLGGVFTKDTDKGESRVPLLGRIPLIGWLFKNVTYDEPQKELMIFITPKLVKQAAAQV